MITSEGLAQPQETPSAFYVPTTKNEVLQVCLFGMAGGLLIPLLGMFISSVIIGNFFCTAESSVCASKDIISDHISAILIGLAAFAALMNLNVYRALLLVFCSTVATWGFVKYAQPILENSRLEYFLLSALLYILAFLTFYWLLRIKNFSISFALVFILTIGACVAMVA